ncbi:MAG: hypothetical protein U0325_04685 [Polyangiales bacterium]
MEMAPGVFSPSFLLLTLLGAPLALCVAGLIYWLIRVDLNVDALIPVARRLLASQNGDRLLKIARVDSTKLALAMLEHALTLDPASVRPRGAPEGGYRDDRPLDRDALIRAHLRGWSHDRARLGHHLWGGSAVMSLPAFGVFAVYGPWSGHDAGGVWLTAVAALALFAALTLARARVLRRVDALAEFIAPHAGSMAQARR